MEFIINIFSKKRRVYQEVSSILTRLLSKEKAVFIFHHHERGDMNCNILMMELKPILISVI